MRDTSLVVLKLFIWKKTNSNIYNGINSLPKNVTCGVPQRPILKPAHYSLSIYKISYDTSAFVHGED